VFYDTEFYEDGSTIKPISIGMVAVLPATHEDPNPSPIEYYAVFDDPQSDALYKASTEEFHKEHVLPHLPLLTVKEAKERSPSAWAIRMPQLDFSDPSVKPPYVIRNEIRELIRSLSNQVLGPSQLELWADYADYDHILLCQLFGRMIDLPKYFPKFTHDIQQLRTSLHVGHSELPKSPKEEAHNALNDARNAHERWRFLRRIQVARGDV
jgi:hypothetical protein